MGRISYEIGGFQNYSLYALQESEGKLAILQTKIEFFKILKKNCEISEMQDELYFELFKRTNFLDRLFQDCREISFSKFTGFPLIFHSLIFYFP